MAKVFLNLFLSFILIISLQSCQITCSSYGNGFLIIGDSVGLISFVSHQHSLASFNSYKIAVTHCCSIKNQSTTLPAKVTKSNFHLVTIGTDNDDLVPILKIWIINEASIVSVMMSKNKNNQPDSNNDNGADDNTSPLAQCIRTIKLCSTACSQLSTLRMHSTVTCLDVLGNSMIAVGFNDGHCLIIRGELIRDRNLRLKLIEVSPNVSITNVAFAMNQRVTNVNQKQSRDFDSKTTKNITLFVATRHEICSYNLSGRDYDKFLLGIIFNFGY